MNPTRIESVSIRGFRSLADFKITELPNAAVLIGANGSGKSNFIRFFEMMSWMLRSRNLAEFIERQGGADDQLFRGNRTTPRMDAEISLRTDMKAGTTTCLRSPMLTPTVSSLARRDSGSAVPTVQRRRLGNLSRADTGRRPLSTLATAHQTSIRQLLR